MYCVDVLLVLNALLAAYQPVPRLHHRSTGAPFVPPSCAPAGDAVPRACCPATWRKNLLVLRAMGPAGGPLPEQAAAARWINFHSWPGAAWANLLFARNWLGTRACGEPGSGGRERDEQRVGWRVGWCWFVGYGWCGVYVCVSVFFVGGEGGVWAGRGRAHSGQQGTRMAAVHGASSPRLVQAWLAAPTCPAWHPMALKATLRPRHGRPQARTFARWRCRCSPLRPSPAAVNAALPALPRTARRRAGGSVCRRHRLAAVGSGAGRLHGAACGGHCEPSQLIWAAMVRRCGAWPLPPLK